MFKFSMAQIAHSHSHKLDNTLHEKIVDLYKPFRWIPSYLHKISESLFKITKKLSVIIEYNENCFQDGCLEVHQAFGNCYGCNIRNEFSTISCCSANLTPSGLEKILTNCNHIKKVYLNHEVRALLDTAVLAANAKNIVRNCRMTLTGKGITVAVIDTGIYPHTDLSGRIIGFIDFINKRTKPYDDNGHGTHCAGAALGNGSTSSGLYMGSAPEANVIGVKVLDKLGSGSLETVLQGVDWCIKYNDNHPNQKINIINMSLGAPAQRYDNENDDPLVKIVEKAWENGIVVCVAAGNEGPEANTIASPGVSEQVITVGALNEKTTADTRFDDEVAIFSSRGPTIYEKTKPDILAPGVDIISLRSPNSYLDKTLKRNRVGSNYFSLSGTSMATPICAGIVALILQKNPNATPQEVKDLLLKGTDLWTDRDPNIYGAGYINAENSIPDN